jgi:hypothetical protein
MPTGYTAAVQDGKVTTLRQFAMQCARAFGATITMRDDPWDKAIPDRFEPETRYYDEGIEKTWTILAELLTLSDAECERRATAEHANLLDSHRQYLRNKDQSRQRYEAMRDQVIAWQVPEEIASLRTFMLEQLTQSIDFDCDTKYNPEEPKVLTGEAWRSSTLAQAAKDLGYYIEKRQEEIERAASRNHWLASLREALIADGTNG